MPREKSSFLFLLRAVPQLFYPQRQSIILSSRNSQKLLLLSPALTSPWAEKKSWTFPISHVKEERPRKPGPGESVGQLGQSPGPGVTGWDDFGSENHRVTEKHGESQHEGWNHILQFQSWERLGLGHVHGHTKLPSPPPSILWVPAWG